MLEDAVNEMFLDISKFLVEVQTTHMGVKTQWYPVTSLPITFRVVDGDKITDAKPTAPGHLSAVMALLLLGAKSVITTYELGTGETGQNEYRAIKKG